MTIPVLVDTDCNIDDWLAIGYLLGSSNVRIEGITTTGVGMAHLTAGTRMMAAFLEAVGANGIPVIEGTNAPLSYSNVYPCKYRRFADSGFGLGLTAKEIPPQGIDAADFMYATAQTLANNGQKLTVLAIGGATNLAIMLQRYPQSFELLEGIVFMGGALSVRGNVADFNPDYTNTVAEWNFFVDPVAAQMVVQTAGTSLTLVPLDLTNQVPLTQTFLHNLNCQATSNTARRLAEALSKQFFGIAKGGYYFWDPLAAAILAASVASTKTQNVIVTTELNEEEDLSGAIQTCTSGGTAITVAASLDMSVEDFQNDFITTLNAVPCRIH